jgi:hypothetical protein
MKRLKIMGVCAIAVCSVGLITGGVASAATYQLTGLPELGRCVKLASKTGLYKYKNCVVQSEGSKGSFEWEPGPGEKPGFVAGASEVKLETVGGVRITCASGEISGSWNDGKTATVNAAFRGCASREKGCGADPSKPVEITTEGSPVEGEIGFIEKGEKPKVGLDLKPKSPATSLLKFNCGGPPEVGLPEPWTVEGSVIGKFRYVDHLQTSFGLLYQGPGGKQIPQKFEEGVKDTPIANRLTESGLVTEEMGLTLKEEKKWIPGDFEEPLEIKAK